MVLGDLSQHVIDQVLKIKRPALNLNKLALLGKGNTMFKKEKDPLEKLDSPIRINNSSLFMFHIDSKFRRFCLKLTEEPELI